MSGPTIEYIDNMDDTLGTEGRQRKSSPGSPSGEYGLTPQGAVRNPQAGASSGVSIHTGFPNAATDTRLRGLDLNQLLVQHPSSTFMFRVRGERGITQGIFDGDLAIVDRLATPRAQDLVLWHDNQRFNLSRPSHMAEGAVRWGTVTAVIHQYRGGSNNSRTSAAA